MRKYLVIGIFLSLAILLLATQVPSVAGQDFAVPGNGSVFTGNCEGMPSYSPGFNVGVFISCSPDRTSWSVFWNGDIRVNDVLLGRNYLFTGDIRADLISNVSETLFEGPQPDFALLVDGVNSDILNFSGTVAGHHDGIGFTTTGSRVLFALDGNLIEGNGSYTLTPADIFIGADGEHPDSVKFSIVIP